jgi:ESCRT-II complex subunit VPS22
MSSNRRGVGLSAFSRNTITSSQYAAHGSQLRSTHLSSLQTQLSVFQQLLHQFSITHAKDIRSNPSFRAEFARMCNVIGVDPLASSHTSRSSSASGKDGGGGGASIWAQLLGGSVNDFYFELAVRVVEVCRDTRQENGGMIAVGDVKQRLHTGKGIGGGMEVSEYVVLSLFILSSPSPFLYAALIFWQSADGMAKGLRSLPTRQFHHVVFRLPPVFALHASQLPFTQAIVMPYHFYIW